jgi:hypothetical protein
MIGCDTSFLHSLYLIDSHTGEAREFLTFDARQSKLALSVGLDPGP